MATLLRMPEVAANATHAALAAWNKKSGDAVAAGELLAEIESEKAVVEFCADAAGVLGSLLVKGGQEVEVGAPIAVLLAPGEVEPDLATLLGDAAPAPLAAPAPAAVEAKPAVTQTTRVLASPLAKRLAQERGIDLSGRSGSGPRGRIVKRDLDGFAPVAVPAATATASEWTDIPHSAMRRTIARRLAESKATVPHFYLSIDCRMDRLLDLRAELNAVQPKKVSVNDFIVRASALALREVPAANVAWTDTAMRQFSHADISVAVATASGLITPIVRAAESKSLVQISSEIGLLAERARAGRLRPEEFQGGSFSISNLGMHGVDEFSAIVNPPQAAILAVGATRQQPVVVDGQLAVGQLMRCTLSADHRALDGAVAAQWLAAFRKLIEAPLALLA